MGDEKFDLAFLDDLTAQDSTKVAMQAFIEARFRDGLNQADASSIAGITPRLVNRWREDYKPFRDFYDTLSVKSGAIKAARKSERQMKMLAARGMVIPRTRTFPDKGGLVDFARDYFGRPSQPHHQAFAKAYEDQTNTKILFLMPTGAGKDTKAIDAILWDKVDDRGLLRTAFILENDEFAKRRLARLTRYLVDPTLYDIAPAETEGGSKPTRNLITDFGPFRWHKDMVWEDGTELERTVWNAHQATFVGSPVNEADPDLWATGLNGDLYGTRLRRVVLSDIFTQKNQANPSMRHGQMSWLRGTFDTRLDGRGRVCCLGTMLLEENNYETLAVEWAGQAGIVYSDEFYTKYRNGFAIVRWPAILDEGTERERSFWEDRFPYRTQMILYGPNGAIKDRVDAHELSDTEYMEKADQDYRVVEGLVEARGAPGTERWKQFRATRQQIREEDADLVEFTDDILDMADDYDRSWGMIYPNEIPIQGVDPAKKYGAAVSVLAVNRQAGTITPVYDFFDSNLGIEGIKTKLIVNPAMTWMPLWLCYEINKHEGVLEDTEVRKQLKQLGVNVHPHQTTPHNRNSLDEGPAGMVSLMRSRTWRWPMLTAEDREKTAAVKAHFKAWDRHDGANQRTSRPGMPGHRPDDRCMANWIATVKAVPVLEQGTRKKRLPRQAVPPSVLRRWEQYQQQSSEKERLREADALWQDGQNLDALISLATGNEDR